MAQSPPRLNPIRIPATTRGALIRRAPKLPPNTSSQIFTKTSLSAK